mgnify:CR=1 FL=1
MTRSAHLYNFIRYKMKNVATGEIAATSGTEGPGFTNMICAIASARRSTYIF